MASTSNQKRATSLDKSGKSSPKRSPEAQKQSPKPSKSNGSMGLGLILIAIGTSLVGLGGLGYFVYQELMSAAGREVERSAEAQTQTITSKLSSVSQSVDMTASAAKSLQMSKPRAITPYQNLLVEVLNSESAVAGLGIVSSGNLLPPPAKAVSTYVWQQKAGIKVEPAGKPLAANILVSSRADSINSDWYKQSVAGKSLWTKPYDALGKKLITYSAPVSDGSKVVAVINADAIASEILSLNTLNSSVDSKVGYVVFGADGAVITGSEQFVSQQSQNPAIAESLTSLAQQSASQTTGIAQLGGNLWAYRKVANSGVIVAAYLPQSEIISKLALLVGGAAIGISAILTIAIFAFVNNLKKRLQPLVEDCDRFLTQHGEPTKNASAKGDELDRLSASLKSTLQQIKSSEVRLRNELSHSSDEDISRSQQVQQSLAETEMIEAEVGDLLDVVSSMEEGDLTIEAQVNDRATGLVADTLNRLREKLVEIISSVLGTAQQVAKGASDLEELAKTVVLNTAEQAQSVIQGQALTEQVANIAKQSAEQVNVANLSLQEVRDTVSDGQTAINTLTESISLLQTGSAQIVQRMKTLGEFVGLAEQFVQDQGQIASLTQVLALNATLVAARAAEQKDPKQFTSVAREFESIAGQVNDLATQTNDGLTVLQQRTSQIQTVVTAIDTEVQNLSGLVSGFTEGVESSQAAFNSIQVATEEVVQIGQTITSSSTEIAEAAGTTATYISEIAQLAERTANLTRSARQQAESMGNQAQQLLQGIQFFRLPESAIAAIDNAAKTASPTVDPSIDAGSPSEINQFYDNDLSAIAEDEDDNDLGFVMPTLAVAGAAAVAVNQFSSQPSPEPEQFIAADEIADPFLEQTHSQDVQAEFPDQYSQAQDLDLEAVDEFGQESEYQDLDDQNFINDSVEYADPMLLEPVDNFVDNSLPLTDDLSEYSEVSDAGVADISVIEASLFADMKQEIYDDYPVEDDQADQQVNNLLDDQGEQIFDQVFDQETLPQEQTSGQDLTFAQTEQFEQFNQFAENAEDLDELNFSVDLGMGSDVALENPLDDFDQAAIAEASIDPMIASATSSFVEDTQFGTPSPLSEEMLANVPTSVDFAIPTLENDDDFAIPPMQIESSLDDSNSFFDSDSYTALDSETNLDDPFAVNYGESLGDDPFDSNLDVMGNDMPNDMSNEFAGELPTNGFESEFNSELSPEFNSELSPELGLELAEPTVNESEYSLDENPVEFDLSAELDYSMEENLDALSDESTYADEVNYATDANFSDALSDESTYAAEIDYATDANLSDELSEEPAYSIDYSSENNFGTDISDTFTDDMPSSFDSFTDRLSEEVVSENTRSEFDLDFSDSPDEDIFGEPSSESTDSEFEHGLEAIASSEESEEAVSSSFDLSFIEHDDELSLDVDDSFSGDYTEAVDTNLGDSFTDSFNNEMADGLDAEFANNPSEQFSEPSEQFSEDLNLLNDLHNLDNDSESGELDVALAEEPAESLDSPFDSLDEATGAFLDESVLESGDLEAAADSISSIFDADALDEFASLSSIITPSSAELPKEPSDELSNELSNELSDEPVNLDNIDSVFDTVIDDGIVDDVEVDIFSEPVAESTDVLVNDNFGAIELNNFTDDMDGVSYNFDDAIELSENNDFTNDSMGASENESDFTYSEIGDSEIGEIVDSFDHISELGSFSDASVDVTDDMSGFDSIFDDLDGGTELEDLVNESSDRPESYENPIFESDFESDLENDLGNDFNDEIRDNFGAAIGIERDESMEEFSSTSPELLLNSLDVDLLDGAEGFVGEDELEIISEVNPMSESAGLDFSDSWLDDIVDDDDDTSAVFGMVSTESLEEQSYPSIIKTATDNLEGVENNEEFDFSAFDDLSALLEPQPQSTAKPDAQRSYNQVSEAQSEIDAFLSLDLLENDERV